MLSVKVDQIPILPIGDSVDQGPTIKNTDMYLGYKIVNGHYFTVNLCLHKEKINFLLNSHEIWIKQFCGHVPASSVTTFGKILSLWQHYINLCRMVEGLLSVWQLFEPTLAK